MLCTAVGTQTKLVCSWRQHLQESVTDCILPSGKSRLRHAEDWPRASRLGRLDNGPVHVTSYGKGDFKSRILRWKGYPGSSGWP